MSSGPRSYRIMVAIERRERPATTTPRVLTGVRRIPFVSPSDSLAGRAGAAASNAARRRHLCGPQSGPASSAPSRCGCVVSRCGWWLERCRLRVVRPRPVPAGRAQRRSMGGGPAPRAPPLSRTMCSNSRPHAAAGRRVGTSSHRNKLPPAGSTGCVPAGDRCDRRAGGSVPNAMKVLRVGRGNGPQQRRMA